MRRLRIDGIGQIAWEEMDIPATPGPHQVVIQATTSLISVGTEMAIFTGSHRGFQMANPPFPLVPNYPGYALVGLITAAGEASGFHVGQRVLAEASHGDVAVVDVRATTVFPLPHALDDATATLLRMAYIALTAVRVAPLQLGETAAVFGMGLVGQLAAQLCAANGAGRVFGVDRLVPRLDVAAAAGIHTVDGAQTDVVAAIQAQTDGHGADVCVEATGSPAVLPHCLEATRQGGRVVQLGSPRGTVELDVYTHVHRRGISLLGAHESVQSRNTRWTKVQNLALLTALFTTGRLQSNGLLSHRIRPAELLHFYPELAETPHEYLGILVDWR